MSGPKKMICATQNMMEETQNPLLKGCDPGQKKTAIHHLMMNIMTKITIIATKHTPE